MPAPVHVDLERLRQLIEVDGLTARAAAVELGVSQPTALRRIRKAGIEWPRRPVYWDRGWLLAREHDGLTIEQTARMAGVSVTAIAKARRRAGLVRPTAPKRHIDMAEVERRLAAGQ